MMVGYGFFGEKFLFFKLTQNLQEYSVRGTESTLLTETSIKKLLFEL